ncbi:hypothetical protein HYALB_00004274 [Hymenoscyphus albidus]|uniref:Heterokaryon incompatibility domain-containing protein n=1 Tax=Hymenoscyphus albidus TaxID=595503 RepID=A0A9N9LK54_9HELO|nr:hypothetical protein HYALB_00004274 [Hymenoscyphus albidus]
MARSEGLLKGRVPVTLCSTKFNQQRICFEGREAGTFRGEWIPDDWLEYCTSEDTYTGAEDILQCQARLICRWADVCFDSHTKCGKGSGFLPTRLIDVGMSNSMKLYLVKTSDVLIDDRRYLALSHCWGLAMTDTARTLNATIEKKQISIQEDELTRVNRSTTRPTDPRTKIALSWMNLIVQYTNRNLTKHSDILPAISGIARTIAGKTSGQYLAGLWRSYFQHCLLWKTERGSENGLQTHTKPFHNTAPSWSWASMKGKISWPMGNHYYYNPDPDPEFIPKILDIAIEPLGSDPYGMLKEGILHIEGKVAVAYSVPGEELKSPITREDVGWVSYDIPLCSDCAPAGQPRIVFLMCCLNDKKSDGEEFWTYAIVLQPVLDNTEGIPGTMRRMGLASRIKPEFWNSNTTLMQLKIC